MKKRLPEIPLIPRPTTEEGKSAIGYKWNDVAGTRHKLGGQPLGLTNEDFPVCSECNEQMTFYGQLDSLGDDYDLADCGLIHVFVCFDCFTTTSQLAFPSTSTT